MNHIQYRGYFNGKGDWAGSTSLYSTEAEALACARRCCSPHDRVWANPEFTGPLDTLLIAKEPIKGVTGTFKAGELLLADITRGEIGFWLLKGKVVAPQTVTFDGQATDLLGQTEEA